MLDTTLTRIRAQDTAVWRTATRSAPVVVQFVWATVFGSGWLLARLQADSGTGLRIVVAIATLLTTGASLLVGAALLRAESPRRRGIGLAVGGSGLVALVSGLAYAVIFLPLLDPGA